MLTLNDAASALESMMPNEHVLVDKLSLGIMRLLAVTRIVSVASEMQLIDIVSSREFGHMLIIDGEVQLAQSDERLYHELLIHPAMVAVMRNSRLEKSVLILGGGDGCAARELLKWNSVASISIVEHDPRVVEVFSTDGILGRLFDTDVALSDSRVTVHLSDVKEFLATAGDERWDLIVVDLTDGTTREILGGSHPQDEFASRLCPDLAKHLAPGGVVGAQTGSANIVLGASNAGDGATRYSSYIPSFGEVWTFTIAPARQLHMLSPAMVDGVLQANLREGLRFYNGSCHARLLGCAES